MSHCSAFFPCQCIFFSVSLCSGLRGGREEAKRPKKVAKEEVRRNVLTRRRCSLGEVKTCAKMLQDRHKARVIKAGFGCVFDLKVDSNISRPLMGNIYTRIDPSTMILDMGEANKVIRITSDAIHHLFGFPQGNRTP